MVKKMEVKLTRMVTVQRGRKVYREKHYEKGKQGFGVGKKVEGALKGCSLINPSRRC